MTMIAEAQDTVSKAPGFTPEQIEAEIASRLPEEARASGQPAIVIIMGPICAGKTTLRRQKYASGHVLVDAAPCPGGVPATVINVASTHWTLVREGAIKKTELVRFL